MKFDFRERERERERETETERVCLDITYFAETENTVAK